MFNILVDLLPNTVEVGGVEYPIATDFRTSILFEQAVCDPDIDEDSLAKLVLDYYYPGVTITKNNMAGLIEQALKFYKGGFDIEDNKVECEDEYSEGEEEINDEKIYDYDYDAPYIFSAFMQQYGIDLQRVKYLHWWKFKAMLTSLQEDCKFCKILEYRSINLSEIEDEKQRSFYRKMKEVYKLRTKQVISEEKKSKQIAEMLKQGIDPKNLF